MCSVNKKHLTPPLSYSMICRVIAMDKIFEQTLLYDFYGELLTPHQREVYEDAVCNDMSLSEIAGERGISRQGVHDLLRRCDRILQDYESKLHLVERFVAAREKIAGIARLTGEDSGAVGNVGLLDNAKRMEKIRELCQELMEDL